MGKDVGSYEEMLKKYIVMAEALEELEEAA
jgi:hypothetical protein